MQQNHKTALLQRQRRVFAEQYTKPKHQQPDAANHIQQKEKMKGEEISAPVGPVLASNSLPDIQSGRQFANTPAASGYNQ